MSEHDRGDGSKAGQLFRALKGRPTPELDAEAAWRRLEKNLGDDTEEPAVSGAAAGFPALRGVGGLAVAASLVLAVALGVWVAAGGLAGDRQPAERVADDPGVPSQPSELATATADGPDGRDGSNRRNGPATASEADVLWAGAAPQEPGPVAESDVEEAEVADAGAPTLELRLARGYRGAPSEALLAEAVGEPADRSGIQGVPGPAAGAGGASPVLDIADRLAGVLEHDGYVLLGRWQGSPAAAGASVRLGDYEIRLDPATGESGAGPAGDPGRLEIREVALVDAESGRRLPIAAELILEPGRLYLLGVREAADHDPDLVLALRLRSGERDRGEG